MSRRALDRGLQSSLASAIRQYALESRKFTSTVRLHNLSNQDIRLVGWKPKCGTSVGRVPNETVKAGRFVDVPVSSILPESGTGELELSCFAEAGGQLVEETVVVRVSLGEFKELVAAR